MFVDSAQVTVKAGDGGPGIVSFRHEKYVDRGGPDGGDGGNGGNVIARATSNQHTLAQFRFKKLVKAKDGKSGGKRKKHGKKGEDITIDVPIGTSISNQDGDQLADMVEEGQTVLLAQGGKGGFGNAHFTTSTRQAPRIADQGEPGEEIAATLELKMIADVGLVGLPNAGKSTLLATLSNAKPEIANYPFTTIQPHLGVVDMGSSDSLLFADIPGLIEGASQGKGLGDAFLRHVERTSVLLHMIDVYEEDKQAAYKTINHELGSYRINLTEKPQVVALTKTEHIDADMLADAVAQIKKVAGEETSIYCISAHTKAGISELLHELKRRVETYRATQELDAPDESTDDDPVITLKTTNDHWDIEKQGSSYVVHGKKLERFAYRTDTTNDEAVQRLRAILRKNGVMHELVRQGIEPGDTISIGKTDVRIQY